MLEGFYFDHSINYLNANLYLSDSPRIEYKDWLNSKCLEIYLFVSFMRVNNTLIAERPNQETCFICIVLYMCTLYTLIPKIEVYASEAIHVGDHQQLTNLPLQGSDHAKQRGPGVTA